MSPLTIRVARENDADVLVDFNAAMAMETENLTLDRAILTRGVRAVLADEAKGVYFVAEIDGNVVGQLMITREWSDWRDGDMWWIQSVYTHPDFRGRGVFASLFRHVEQLARASGAAGLRLYVEAHNAPARATYAKLGLAIAPYAMMETVFKPAGVGAGG